MSPGNSKFRWLNRQSIYKKGSFCFPDISLSSHDMKISFCTVGANKSTESKEISNVAMESTTMTTEAPATDDGVASGKGALASKDSGDR